MRHIIFCYLNHMYEACMKHIYIYLLIVGLNASDKYWQFRDDHSPNIQICFNMKTWNQLNMWLNNQKNAWNHRSMTIHVACDKTIAWWYVNVGPATQLLSYSGVSWNDSIPRFEGSCAGPKGYPTETYPGTFKENTGKIMALWEVYDSEAQSVRFGHLLVH